MQKVESSTDEMEEMTSFLASTLAQVAAVVAVEALKNSHREKETRWISTWSFLSTSYQTFGERHLPRTWRFVLQKDV